MGNLKLDNRVSGAGYRVDNRVSGAGYKLDNRVSGAGYRLDGVDQERMCGPVDTSFSAPSGLSRNDLEYLCLSESRFACVITTGFQARSRGGRRSWALKSAQKRS